MQSRRNIPFFGRPVRVRSLSPSHARWRQGVSCWSRPSECSRPFGIDSIAPPRVQVLRTASCTRLSLSDDQVTPLGFVRPRLGAETEDPAASVYQSERK